MAWHGHMGMFVEENCTASQINYSDLIPKLLHFILFITYIKKVYFICKKGIEEDKKQSKLADFSGLISG
jgi:hypothetical protein